MRNIVITGGNETNIKQTSVTISLHFFLLYHLLLNYL